MFTLKDLCIALLSFAVVVILRSLRKASSEVHVNLPIMLGWFEGFVSLDEAIVRMTNALYAAKTQGLTLKRTLQSNTTVSVSITDANKTGTATLMFAARNKAASKLAQHLNELLQREDLKEFTK